MSTTRRLYLPSHMTLAGLAKPCGDASAEGDGAKSPHAAPPVPPTSPIALDDDEAHYGRHVLRLADRASVIVLDGTGHSQSAIVCLDGKRGLSVTLTGSAGPAGPLGAELTLVVAVPKGERADWLVEKACELGVKHLRWTLFARSNPGPSGSDRLARWLRLARAAGRQAQHGHLPSMTAPAPLAEVMPSLAQPAAHKLVAHPGPHSPLLSQMLATTRPAGPTVVVIGPEGGLDPDELRALTTTGYSRVSLGPHVLRLETAAMVAAAASLWASCGTRVPGKVSPGPQQTAKDGHG